MTMRLVELVVHPLGAVEAIYAGYDRADRYLIEDGAVGYEIEPVREVFGADIGLDLIGLRDGGTAAWRLREAPKDTRLETDFTPDAVVGDMSRLDIPAKARTGATVVHVDPLGAPRTPVIGDRRYRLELDAGADTATADLLVLLFDENGGHVDSVRRKIAGFDRLRLDFKTPGEAAWLEIAVVARADKTGGAVRLGRPGLCLVDDGGKISGMASLRRRDLEALRRAGPAPALARIRLPLPGRMLDGGRRTLRLRIEGESGLARTSFAFEASTRFALSKRGVERASAVRLAGRVPEGEIAACLQVVVDGRLSSETAVAAPNGKFDVRLAVGDAHLDGRAHRIEVRDAPTQAVIYSTHQRTAAFHARWPVLQAYAQAPLSAETSPAVDGHLRALQAWAGRGTAGGSAPGAARLHREVLAGPNPRPTYPSLGVPAAERPRVSVIVPAHGKFEMTHLCLGALAFAAVETAFEVIVVDDGSPDETGRIESIVAGVRVVRHETARGFIAACKAGAAQAKGEFLVFLNNDTEVTAGWLDELVGAFDRFGDVGLTGAKLIYPDGRLQEAGGVVWGSGDPWNAGRGGEPDDPAWTYAREVDYLSGAAIMIPRALWDELGGFDDAYAPAYFEDTDLAMKVRAAGRRVVYVPTAEVYHFEGATSGVDKAEGAKRFQELNRPKFKKKWKALYAGRRPVGERLDLEKDRGVVLRALWLAAPPALGGPDADAVRALQAVGCKVTILPPDVRYSSLMEVWRRDGVECLSAPWVEDPIAWLEAHVSDYDVVAPATDATRALISRLAPSPPIFDAPAASDFAGRIAATRAALAQLDLFGLPGEGLHVKPRARAAKTTPKARKTKT